MPWITPRSFTANNLKKLFEAGLGLRRPAVTDDGGKVAIRNGPEANALQAPGPAVAGARGGDEPELFHAQAPGVSSGGPRQELDAFRGDLAHVSAGSIGETKGDE